MLANSLGLCDVHPMLAKAILGHAILRPPIVVTITRSLGVLAMCLALVEVCVWSRTRSAFRFVELAALVL